jgi:SecD/SecF fusion protein
MVDNIGRKIAIIALFLAVSIASLSLAGFRMGLDLQGGTRLVYRIDFQKAVDDNQIDAESLNNKGALLQEIISIIKQRVDPQGVREPIIRAEGTDRIVIELPGSGTEVRQTVTGGLAAALPAGGLGADTITLSGTDDELDAFPLAGGIVQVDEEQISYSKREGSILKGLQRPYSGTTKTAHAAGAAITLKNIDPWRTLIENVGNMTFHIAARDQDFENQSDLTAETERARAWITANPELDITSYNRLSREEGGPWRSSTTEAALVFFPMPNTDGITPLGQRIRGLLVEANPDWRFIGSDLLSGATSPSSDSFGYPAVAFAMKDGRRSAFGDFTGAHIDELMAIVINDEIATMPNIEGQLPGGGIITGGVGGFTPQEVTSLVTVLRSGSLRIKPELEHQERVGATLGEDYVKKGAFSAILGMALVLLFMLVYYRRLGVYAALSLLANMTMLMGALSFLQATLTLPGVAGIILTVGMAVDANILIFERIREEALRGRKPLQAAKNGFQHALSTIVDANMTTLITALILYKFGTGPIKGFATTLSIGILTSMFSALIITKVLVHGALEGKVESWSMMRSISDTKIKFMSKAKLAMPTSVVLILAGLFLFTSIDTEKKLGIDFLGGASLTVRTQEPQPVEEIRALVSNVQGVIGKSSEVKAILNSEAEAGTYNQFRITFKTPQSVIDEAMSGQGADGVELTVEQVQDSIKATVETQIRDALASVLEKGPFENIAVTGTAASGILYFEIPHDSIAIGDVLNTVGVNNNVVTQVSGPVAAYSFTGSVNAGMTTSNLENLIQTKFQETIDTDNGEVFAWANPIPETSIVGAAVVAELRDAAIFAILLSLFAVVMYIRVRFAEYSYGFAAVCALVHDVLFTVGVLGIAIMTDFIEAEINLPMIAAFLTIIGYSLNDTIVVFDRIRENLPRMSGSMAEIIDTSINQTLSRTILTSVTTLLTVLILFFFNLGSRNVLEGFSFAMAVGVIVGTYSSMFIAAPTLLWLEQRRNKDGDAQSSSETTATAEPALQA